MHPLHQIIRLWIFDFFKTDLISKSFSKAVNSSLNCDPLSKTNLRVHGYLIIHLLLNNCLTLADDLSMYSSLLPITTLRSYVSLLNISNLPIVDHCDAGETNITLNDSTSCLMLSYILAIWTYQVRMHQIPRF